MNEVNVEKGYDPLKIAEEVVRTIDDIEERKYYRFRKNRWYGRITTGDVVGCNLRC